MGGGGDIAGRFWYITRDTTGVTAGGGGGGEGLVQETDDCADLNVAVQSFFHRSPVLLEPAGCARGSSAKQCRETHAHWNASFLLGKPKVVIKLKTYIATNRCHVCKVCGLNTSTYFCDMKALVFKCAYKLVCVCLCVSLSALV